MRPNRLALGLAAPFALTAFAHAAPPPDARAAARAWVDAHQHEILVEYAELLAIPNVASDTANIARNADQILALLRRRGFEARLLDGEGGPPAVYAELRSPGATRTLTIYAHYDGQPVDAARWASPPWTPTLRKGLAEDGAEVVPMDALPARLEPEWRLYARSTGDDKAPIAAITRALDALAAAGRKPSVNLKLFFEGEEEAGSDHLGAVLQKHAELLKADLFLLCDGPVHQTRKPQLYFGARGVTGVELTVYGAARTLHSGHYGNWAPNPALLLSHLIASLRDPDGRILIDGYLDDVRPPTAAENEALARVPEVDAALREELSLAATEAGNAPLVGRIMLPALNVRGVQSGYLGDRAANAIPSSARASIDLRLVPDQTPASVRAKLEAHLARRGWHLVHEAPAAATLRAHPRVVRLDWEGGYPAARTPLDQPAARALVRALEQGAREPYVLMPTLGGSIPMHLFQQALRVPVVGLPVANHDNNQHSANENIRLQNLWDAIEAYAGLFANLGPELARPAAPPARR
jgi:acetylornithine deacetylase/succinyl-diaminopimelate desuccinylase-like protein